MNKFKNILEKLGLAMKVYAAQPPFGPGGILNPPNPRLDPRSPFPFAPSYDDPILTPDPSPSNPSSPSSPSSPPSSVMGCDGQPIDRSVWPKISIDLPPADKCSSINKYYTALRGHLSACKGQCGSSDDPEYDFENCLNARLDQYFSQGSAGGSILHKSEGMGPPEQLEPARVDQTLQRNCIINKIRCNCEFNERRLSFLLEQSRLAELYAAGCKPFAIASSTNPIEANKAEEARKKKFKIACAELTKDYPSPNRCHKGANGKRTYGKACEYICTKCGETGSVIP